MKKLILALAFLVFSVSGYADTWVDGYKYDEFEISAWHGMSAPSVSDSGTARIYYDSIADTLKLSLDGGAYADISTGSGSGSVTTMKEATVQVGGADIVTLDFGAGFDLAETPNTEVNITLDLSEVASGGELGGNMDAPTIDDSVAVASWNLTTPTITTSLTTSTPKTISVAELDRLDGLAGIIVTDVTACTDLEGTGLSIGGTTLNWAAASTDLSDTADLLYEAELDDLSELTTQIADVTAFVVEGTACSDVEGRSLTIGTGTLDVDAELYTDVKCMYWESPLATDDFYSIWRNSSASAYTITEIWAESDQTVTFMLQIGGADCDTVDLAPAAGEAEDVALDGTVALGVDAELDLAVTSVANTPTWCSICWTYTKDD